MMLALLIYAHSHGVRSSRVIERLCRRDAGYRFIVGDEAPDHTVIARFRQRHPGRMKNVFLQVLELCREAGLIRLGLVALDGTKVKANAASTPTGPRAASKNRLAGCWRKPRRPTRGRTASRGRERRSGAACEPKAPRRPSGPAEGVPGEAGEPRRGGRRAPAEKIAARDMEEKATGRRKRGRKPKEPDPSVDPGRSANPTDPDSGIMKTRRGWVQGYNAQAVVTPDQIILAADVTTEANDVRQLTGMLNEAQANVAAVMVKMRRSAPQWRTPALIGGQRGQPNRGVRAVHRHSEGPQAAGRAARGAAPAGADAAVHDSS